MELVCFSSQGGGLLESLAKKGVRVGCPQVSRQVFLEEKQTSQTYSNLGFQHGARLHTRCNYEFKLNLNICVT
jgi:hypothetical protein